MKALPRLLAPVLAIALAACAATAPKSYSGRGGMTAHKIPPEVYVYHYERGFTGPDAMGWDANLQFAWSRIAAARTCGVAFSQSATVAALIKEFGHDKLTHELIGIDFHRVQNAGIADFCSQARIEEARQLVPRMESGEFPKRFQSTAR